MKEKILNRHYDGDEYGFAYLPKKMSGRHFNFVSFSAPKKSHGDEWFRKPHSFPGRSWKLYRDTQYVN